MVKGKTSGLNHRDRRSFLKTNAAIGLGAFASGMAITTACSSDNKSANSDKDLLAKYQECLGGSFPEPVPLNPVLRETILKDGYRIESITY